MIAELGTQALVLVNNLSGEFVDAEFNARTTEIGDVYQSNGTHWVLQDSLVLST